jgi:hypothetical protein
MVLKAAALTEDGLLEGPYDQRQDAFVGDPPGARGVAWRVSEAKKFM